jgi:phosphotransacetylase/acyl dehydratase
MTMIENRPFDEIQVGDAAVIERRLAREDVATLTSLTGDLNPFLVDPVFALAHRFGEPVAPAAWALALVSAVVGTRLPGPGTIILSETLEYRRPVGLDDVLTLTVTVAEKGAARHVVLAVKGINQVGKSVIEGTVTVIAPAEKLTLKAMGLPEIRLLRRGARLADLIERATAFPALKAAIVHPCDEASLGGALDARDMGLLEPILVGPEAKIRAAAAKLGRDLGDLVIVSAEHSHAAADRAVELAQEGVVEALMKGSLHTDELMAAVVGHNGGLRTDRRLSHVFVMDVPRYPKLLLITDAAINIAPNLEEKRDIAQNAIDLALALGIPVPKIAVLSAVEVVTSKIPSTVDAAALSKMADRGQIVGGIVDGPLAFDNAISAEAARTKGIISPVAGQPDILLCPDLESGNMVAKQLGYLADAESSGLVLGARVPVMLTSRADSAAARAASAALAVLRVRCSPKKAG